ncbi:MDR family MFS transporter [Paenibacillus thalictri]|uniref:MFS-type drug efflux transporter P55 n=1 Tax=Paenibacillus thalictri TaxID=2527873 RepID=A0A4V2J4M4_9BACL|nr:MDR family MFS transporter [Paenibacillus thalictri]TBL80361.1 MFS transporter [Paenibacillus thalictri]
MNSKIPVMASIVLAMLVASMDTTIINTTMPIIAAELGHFELYAWSFASYMIVSTVVSPIAGRLSDLFGRKKIFGAGILMFLVGSMLCGLSQTMLQLVVFRGIQGIGAGIMMPFPAIIAGDLFSVEKRGKIQAFFTGMWGISAIMAPMLGAIFVEYATWRWIFYINAPICLISVGLLVFYKESYEPRRSKVDYGGAVLFGAAISLLLCTTVVEKYTFVYGLLGVLLFAVFFMYERRHKSPIVPLTMLKNRSLAWMIINSFLGCAALFGTSSFIPLYLQNQGYSILVSGVALLGMSFGWMTMSVPAGKWIIRWGYRPLLIIGNIFLVLSGLMLSMLQEHTSYTYVFVNMVVQGLAFGMLSTVSIIGSQQLVEAHQKGISTSLMMFARNIGTAIGVTIMGAIVNKAADQFFAGIHHAFIYGLIVSLFAVFASLFVTKHNKETVRSAA